MVRVAADCAAAAGGGKRGDEPEDGACRSNFLNVSAERGQASPVEEMRARRRYGADRRCDGGAGGEGHGGAGAEDRGVEVAWKAGGRGILFLRIGEHLAARQGGLGTPMLNRLRP